ncbi:hypothetical protein HYQ44_002271 [Verticillium longisporum]|nr:hypothetical protein HYQ44_002271 [Verticillium longisporum]
MDEWTQLPNTNSTAMSGTQSPYHGDWAASRRDYDWLLAKACGAQSLIDRRLRSRGLVKTISVKGPDARSVEAAIQAAFGSILHRFHASTSTEFAAGFEKALTVKDPLAFRLRAVKSAQRFTEQAFVDSWNKHLETLLAKLRMFPYSGTAPKHGRNVHYLGAFFPFSFGWKGFQICMALRIWALVSGIKPWLAR